MRVPVSDKEHYDFALIGDETVKQFEDKVIAVCKSSGLSHFRVNQVENEKQIQ